MDWNEIKKRLKGVDAHALRGLSAGWSPDRKFGNAEAADFLNCLVAEREGFETVEAWHARLAEVTRGDSITRLVRIVEAVTDVTDDEAWPTEETRRRARQAEALRQRRPAPVPVDPTLQAKIDLPVTREAMQNIVEAHVRAWLTDFQNLTLPTPVKRYVRVRQWGDGKFAARVRLFNGSTATIYVKGQPERLVRPDIRYRGPDFFYNRELGWMIVPQNKSREAVREQFGDAIA